MPGRGKYLGFVAHEIKNPLATALWAADLLKRMPADERAGERAEKMIDVSLRALRRMRRLIDDFFTIERLLEQGYELRRERLPLRELVASTLQQMAEKEGALPEGVTARVEEGVEVTGDADMLRRALRCLIEHLSRGEKPRVTVSSRGAGLQLSAEPAPSPLVPPAPEERPSGDPTGAVLGYEVAVRILDAHGARIEERDGGLAVLFG